MTMFEWLLVQWNSPANEAPSEPAGHVPLDKDECPIYEYSLNIRSSPVSSISYSEILFRSGKFLRFFQKTQKTFLGLKIRKESNLAQTSSNQRYNFVSMQLPPAFTWIGIFLIEIRLGIVAFQLQQT